MASAQARRRAALIWICALCGCSSGTVSRDRGSSDGRITFGDGFGMPDAGPQRDRSSDGAGDAARTDRRVADATVDQRVVDQQLDRKPGADQKVPDQKVPDQKVPDQKVPDQGSCVATVGLNKTLSTQDYVSTTELPGADGVKDYELTVTLCKSATITQLVLKNVAGAFCVWDTVPNNTNWMLGVSTGAGLLNAANGTISLVATVGMSLRLYIAEGFNCVAQTIAGTTKLALQVSYGAVAESINVTVK